MTVSTTPLAKIAETDNQQSKHDRNKLNDFIFHFGLKEILQREPESM